MYGTIMRAKLKAGQQDAFRRFAQEQGSPTDAGGWVSSEFAVEDKDPNRIVGIIRFKDRDSYRGQRRRRGRRPTRPHARDQDDGRQESGHPGYQELSLAALSETTIERTGIGAVAVIGRTIRRHKPPWDYLGP